VLSGLRGEDSIAELCRREGIVQNLYYRWSPGQHAGAPGARRQLSGAYHAGVEELHLLAGELWIDERKLLPGDYNFGAPGAGDDRVWSDTGCTCLLVTSAKDVLADNGFPLSRLAVGNPRLTEQPRVISKRGGKS
jgi:hypothetical protein